MRNISYNTMRMFVFIHTLGSGYIHSLLFRWIVRCFVYFYHRQGERKRGTESNHITNQFNRIMVAIGSKQTFHRMTRMRKKIYRIWTRKKKKQKKCSTEMQITCQNCLHTIFNRDRTTKLTITNETEICIIEHRTKVIGSQALCARHSWYEYYHYTSNSIAKRSFALDAIQCLRRRIQIHWKIALQCIKLEKITVHFYWTMFPLIFRMFFSV